MEKYTCVNDYLDEAKHKLQPSAYKYLFSGSEREITLKRNISAFQNFYIKPQNLCRSVRNVEMRRRVLGGRVQMDFPIGICPTALQKLAHPDGELATAKACAAHGSVMTLSAWTSLRIEDVVHQFPDPANLWINCCIFKDRTKTMEIIKGAEQWGCGAIVLTCNLQALYQGKGDDFSAITENCSPVYLPDSSDCSCADPSATWRDFEEVTKTTSLPVIAKGITTALDARKAVDHGAAAIWVGNHGGRQLDSTYGSIEVLRDVVDEVGEEVEVYLDSGIRTGTDVFKALALGARAVFVGRPVIAGLACGGKQGSFDVLNILNHELRTTMTLAGCPDVQNLGREYIHDKYRISSL